MIEFLGFLYGLAKDISNFTELREETKSVDSEWIEKSGFRSFLESEGYDLRWSRPQSIPSREIDGWEIVYEIDKSTRTRFKIEWVSRGGRDPLVLIAKKKR